MDNHQSPELKQQMRLQSVGYITGALGLVVGLAWNDAISTLIDALMPFGKDGLWIKFVYAGILTVLVVIVSMRLQRLAMSERK